jgi:hypothetical protein
LHNQPWFEYFKKWWKGSHIECVHDMCCEITCLVLHISITIPDGQNGLYSDHRSLAGQRIIHF